MSAYIQHGPQAWGPKCAKAAGFTRPTGPRAPKATRPADRFVDYTQTILDFFEPITAKQGRLYLHDGQRVIALDNDENPRVGVIAEPWFSQVMRVPASELAATGQRYLQGGLP